MNINIGKYIYNALTAITGLTVYPVIADFESPSPTTPFCVYQRTGMNPGYTKSLWDGSIEHSYSITVADNDYSGTITKAEAVINAILGLASQKKTDIYFNQVTLNDLSEDYIDGIFLQTMSFTINTTRK